MANLLLIYQFTPMSKMNQKTVIFILAAVRTLYFVQNVNCDVTKIFPCYELQLLYAVRVTPPATTLTDVNCSAVSRIEP
jgi:hypothetical protein